MRVDHASTPEALRASGTDNQTAEAPKGALQLAQQLGRAARRSTATGCERESEGDTQKKTPKPLRINDLGDDVRDDATNRESSEGGTRTPDTRIMIRRVSSVYAEENGFSLRSAALELRFVASRCDDSNATRQFLVSVFLNQNWVNSVVDAAQVDVRQI